MYFDVVKRKFLIFEILLPGHSAFNKEFTLPETPGNTLNPSNN